MSDDCDSTTASGDDIVTSGGRVLGVTALGDDIQGALDEAYRAAVDRSLPGVREVADALELPSLSAAVSVDGDVVWQATLGYADLSERTPANPATNRGEEQDSCGNGKSNGGLSLHVRVRFIAELSAKARACP